MGVDVEIDDGEVGASGGVHPGPCYACCARGRGQFSILNMYFILVIFNGIYTFTLLQPSSFKLNNPPKKLMRSPLYLVFLW